MSDASIWMMTLGTSGIIGGVAVAMVFLGAKFREWYDDMFGHDDEEPEDDGTTIEERTRRAI